MRFSTVVFLLLYAAPAMAHHPLDGLPMETLTDGFLSGIGHPLLGFDHLFFVLAMGTAAALSGQYARGVCAYLVCMLAGCALVLLGTQLPVQEIVVSASLVVLGFMIAAPKRLPFGHYALVFSGFGLFHGGAFASTIAGQEATAPWPVLAGYLAGLGIMQSLVAAVAAFLATKAQPITVRLGGAMVAGAGVFLCLEAVEGILLS